MDNIRTLQSLWSSLPSHLKCKKAPNFHQLATQHQNILSTSYSFPTMQQFQHLLWIACLLHILSLQKATLVPFYA